MYFAGFIAFTPFDALPENISPKSFDAITDQWLTFLKRLRSQIWISICAHSLVLYIQTTDEPLIFSANYRFWFSTFFLAIFQSTTSTATITPGSLHAVAHRNFQSRNERTKDWIQTILACSSWTSIEVISRHLIHPATKNLWFFLAICNWKKSYWTWSVNNNL